MPAHLFEQAFRIVDCGSGYRHIGCSRNERKAQTAKAKDKTWRSRKQNPIFTGNFMCSNVTERHIDTGIMLNHDSFRCSGRPGSKKNSSKIGHPRFLMIKNDGSFPVGRQSLRPDDRIAGRE